MLERRIEEAALNSWPALQQMHYDGWLLRFARGYTKRANSITPLYSSLLPLTGKVDTCEYFYKEKKLPTIFRLPSFLETVPELDQLLEQRGYRQMSRTLVLTAELAPEAEMPDPDPHLSKASLTTWLSIFSQLSQSPIEKHQPHQEILERIVARPLFAVLRINRMPVACGLGVLENNIFGMFDVLTAPDQRKKGYGTQLVRSMLDWARQQSATYAYLQVEAANQDALAVYKHLGFQELYHYWYRVRP
ncbi:MAG: GNAT family N-acetyltransferase [Ktedonobacteraceae bacterium]|nr:GNAT family N-acetyltransferase [Ktedonobacteraceae bacterium]